MMSEKTEKMKRQEREIKDPAIINEILTKSLICRIAINDNEYPYIIPVNYGYFENALYFHTAIAGKKIDLLKKNNKVSFEIEYSYEIITGKKSCDWTTKYRSIIGYGKVEIVETMEEKKQGLDVIMQQHGKHDNAYNEKLFNRFLVLKINIESLTGKQSGDW